jgi:hypothetical protein
MTTEIYIRLATPDDRRTFFIRTTHDLGVQYRHVEGWNEVRQYVKRAQDNWESTPRVFWTKPDGDGMNQELISEEDWVMAILSDS